METTCVLLKGNGCEWWSNWQNSSSKRKKGIKDEEENFDMHEQFCRIQVTTEEFPKGFNKEISTTPSLKHISITMMLHLP